MTELSADRGRRPGGPPTREAILAAAIDAFTTRGYAQTTIRGVARTAGVDPALVMHFFGNKDGLFQAAIREGGLPVRRLTEVIGGDLDGLGERLVTRYLELWEDPQVGPRLYAILHAASSTPAAAAMLKGFIQDEVLRPLAAHVGGEQAEFRALLVGSQLIGLAMIRYVLRVEPLCTASVDQVIANVAPTLQRHLTGEPPTAH
ncbi:TetR family transcriptional regulator [Nonomuraea sp. NPDC046570]|uniref:TetR/AcrR family transcriptional regulator n=1 Tax=Nonomuraea sp. NPDC046570 TaxID=3155255 RepID=UPI0034002073